MCLGLLRPCFSCAGQTKNAPTYFYYITLMLKSQEKSAKCAVDFSDLVGGSGIEPELPCGNQILSLARLPVPPVAQHLYFTTPRLSPQPPCHSIPSNPPQPPRRSNPSNSPPPPPLRQYLLLKPPLYPLKQRLLIPRHLHPLLRLRHRRLITFLCRLITRANLLCRHEQPIPTRP